MNGQSTQTASSAAAPAATNFNNAAVHHTQPIVIIQQLGSGGCCSVPPDASLAVRVTRWSSIAIIIIHAIALIIHAFALMAYGFILWKQWIASLIGVIMGSILLCNFNKCCYITASVLFSISVVLDSVAAIIWLVYISGILAILLILGAIAFLIGAIAGCIATCAWDESRAADVTSIQNGPVQISHFAAAPSTQATAVQPNCTHPAASNGAPTTYSSGV